MVKVMRIKVLLFGVIVLALFGGIAASGGSVPTESDLCVVYSAF